MRRGRERGGERRDGQMYDKREKERKRREIRKDIPRIAKPYSGTQLVLCRQAPSGLFQVNHFPGWMEHERLTN